MMDAAERALVRRTLPRQGGELEVPSAEAPLHALFEAAAAAGPQRVAAVLPAESVSYAELNRRANRLAWRLREEHAVEVEDIVGLCVDRGSVGMLVGMLGILKAGAAYVPLDPALPAEHLR